MKIDFDNTPMFPAPGKTPKEDTSAVMKFYKLAKSFPREALAEAKDVAALANGARRGPTSS